MFVRAMLPRIEKMLANGRRTAKIEARMLKADLKSPCKQSRCVVSMKAPTGRQQAVIYSVIFVSENSDACGARYQQSFQAHFHNVCLESVHTPRCISGP